MIRVVKQYICDRCGKSELVPKNAENIINNRLAFDDPKGNWYSWSLPTDDMEYHITNLCEDCAKEFRENIKIFRNNKCKDLDDYWVAILLSTMLSNNKENKNAKLDKSTLEALDFCSGNGKCTECPYGEGHKPTLTCKDLLEKISEYIKSLERSNNDGNL